MDISKERKKRAIIIAVYLLIFFLFGWAIYGLTRPIETCNDGIKNQNEEDVDCGGVCNKCNKIEVKDIKIGKTGFTETGISGVYDIYAIIENPNSLYGVKSFNYTFILKDEAGEILAKKNGANFILPADQKYIVEMGMSSSNKPSKVELEISGVDWQKFDFFEPLQLKVNYKDYSQITSGAGFSQATGVLKNDSPFDFNVIFIKVILYDNQKNVVGLNATEMRTVKSGEEREFRAIWSNKFPGHDYFTDWDVQVEVNVFDSEAFFEKYRNH